MISIQNSMTELERCTRERNEALESYLFALQNCAHYAVEIEDRITGPHRQYLSALAADVKSQRTGALADTRATLRGLLRDYRDKAAQYLGELRDELAKTAASLQEIMESISQTDGDHDQQMRTALRTIRSVAASPDAAPVASALSSAASCMESSLEQMRKQHQFTVAQFLTEIRVLHKRIDSLEAAASIDDATKLANRMQMEDRIRGLAGGPFSLLLIRASGLRQAETTFNGEVAAELCGALSKRLRNALPPNAFVARWCHEGYAAVLRSSKVDAMTGAKAVGEQIGGPYACLLNGKTVRPTLQIRIAVLEHDTAHPDWVIKQVSDFLGT